MNGPSPIDLIRKLLLSEMHLPEDRITVYNQKFTIPPIKGLFIYLEHKGMHPVIANRNRLNNLGTYGAQEEQDLNMAEDVIIGMYSRNTEALERAEEAVMALHSIYAQQLQERHGFKIFRNAPITAVEGPPEGTAILYRFDIEVKMFFAYSKIKTAEFYDSHSVEILTDTGIEVEFVIPDTDPTVYPQT